MPPNPPNFACAAISPQAHNSAAAHGARATSPSHTSASHIPARQTSPWLPLVEALSWHYRTEPPSCLALDASYVAYTPGFLPGAWTWQRCTDLVMAFSVPHHATMLLTCEEGYAPNCAAHGQAALRAYCQQTFGATVPDSAVLQNFWGEDWSAAGGGSHIVFSNGELDPWNYGGVPDDVDGGHKDGPVTVRIAGGAHHLDLRGPNPADPPSVVKARELEVAVIGRWLGFADSIS